jgi:hypothetical protein
VDAEGDGLQVEKVGANVLNKQSRTADKPDPSAWGLVEGITVINQHLTKCDRRPRIWTEFLELSQQWKVDMRTGICSGRGFCRPQSLNAFAGELAKKKKMVSELRRPSYNWESNY